MGASENAVRPETGFDYRPRVADAELAGRLGATGAVVIEGPRGCGKTETARQAAASEVRLDVDDEARAAGLLAPALLLDGDRPRLIDEWQLVPGIWNQVRREVDATGGRPGQFILTGSAVPADDVTRHSGAMRFSRLRMRPMSLAEAGYSTGDISLRGLLDGVDPRAVDPGLAINDLAERITVGGWPSLQDRTVDEALIALRGYLEETRRVDLVRVDGIGRDPENVARVFRSLARNIASGASARAIAADVGGAEGPIDHHTVLGYVAALSRIFVVEDLPAWSPALRSRTILRSAPTRHFVDPSLAVAALGTRPDRLLRDIETLGLLFESLVVRDLRIYAQAQDASVLHYRDSTDLEADAIVERRDGAWAAFEVKLGPSAVDGAARTLLRVAARVDPERHGRPAVLGVITGWGYGYRRPDGVAVIPIGALAP
jgi:predicted AAA+ superfamily ATPase